MQNSQILWMDLRYNKGESCVADCLAGTYRVKKVPGATDIEEVIRLHQPQVLCFDYDYPDLSGLQALSWSKSLYPALPLVMLTDDHSTELAVWALRVRVWNYFIKPVLTASLINSVDVLLQRAPASVSSKRSNLMPRPVLPATSIPYKYRAGGASTKSAEFYVQQHLDDKITLEQAARVCGMSKYHFSRTFKVDHKITFQEYVIQQRIGKAIDLLKGSDMLVTQIALAVGFEDLSYFARTFQKHTGMLPSCYRKSLLSGHSDLISR